MKENLTIGFIGNPNCGKTTLFNAYTGANLKVANWPGVTVEKVEGAIRDHNLNIRLVDLPGTYSLTCLQKPYMKLKVQELLLFLYTVDAAKEKQRERYTSPHVEIVKEIHKKLVSDLQKRPTIEELSKGFLINTTTLKNTFKGIYGQPIGTYMKEYRMKRAAILLRQTQATIAEISNQVGYENQSKFATAFRDVMKITPAEYRKQDEAHLGEDFSIEGISI